MITIKINDIFYSIQGEGVRVGTPTIFVRFSGCNLCCEWCDTRHHKPSIEMTIPEIIARVKKLSSGGCKEVCITGGEPSLQTNELELLIIHLDDAGYKISIETNGTIPFRAFGFHSPRLVISPKREAHFKIRRSRTLQSEDTIKYIVDRKSTVKELMMVMKMHLGDKYNLPTFLIQPVWGDDRCLAKAVVFAKKLNLRLSCQMHKYIDVP